MRAPLATIAHGRSGDKGDGSNIGIIAYNQGGYDFLVEHLTSEAVKEYFREVCLGRVERFEVPNLYALNFILHDSLGGGGTESLKTDAQGKTHAQGLLSIEFEIPDSLIAESKQ